MKRRNFLKLTSRSALGMPVIVNGLGVSALPNASFFNFDDSNDKILVLVQLKGGNDGLNTLIPLDQYSNLSAHRGDIMIPENQVLGIDEKTGLHPSMTGILNLYQEGKIGFIQGVGYPNQNRSHFRSTDIWTSASAAEVVETTGWMGRHLSNLHPEYPTDYPNETYPDPFALTIGRAVSTTCQGPSGNFSLAITDPFSLSPLTTPDDGAIPEGYYGDQLKFMRVAINQTNEYGEVIRASGEKGNNMVEYPDDNRFAQQFKTVAQLISGGLKTKIYIVSLGGFDTHGNQVDLTDPTIGEHAILLKTLSDAIAIFQEDLKQLGLEERVLGMTFSEFGRRIKANGSAGTDHGSAAPLMLFGTCANSGILGDNPDIPAEVSNQDGVAMQYDFRAVYGTVLKDWLGVNEADVNALLFDNFPTLPIVACSTTSNNYLPEDRLEVSVFPNPFAESTNISFTTQGEWIRLSIFDALGKEVKVLADQRFTKGFHQLRASFKHLPKGNYYYRIVTPSGTITKPMVHMK